MATLLTLHQGDAHRIFTEHPVEVARRAVVEAADAEDAAGQREWAGIMRRFASALPQRKLNGGEA